MKRLTVSATIIIGINALLAQVLLIRELLVNFSGNELSMGIMFATWLIAGGLAGVIIAPRLVDRRHRPLDMLYILVMAISVITPLSFFLSRVIRVLLGLPLYIMLSPIQILFISTILLCLVSALLSLAFVTCCKALTISAGQTDRSGLAYALETLGATSAGIIFTLLLVRHMSPVQILSLLTGLNLLLILWISLIQRRWIYTSAALIMIYSILIAAGIPLRIDNISRSLQWYPQHLRAYKDSPYGNISITGSADSYNVYENGTLLFTSQDDAFNEELIHLIMLQHPDPEDVLLIGNGIGGAIRQILKHEPDSLTYLELDPSLIDTAKSFISGQDRDALLDNRVTIINEDGYFFVRRTEKKFDLVILNLPDPTTLLLNRFYTREFYDLVSRSLGKSGMFATKVSSKESILSREQALYNSCVLKTLRSVFTYVEMIPGDNIIFIASDSSSIEDNNPQILIDRLMRRNIKTEFLTRYHITDRYYPRTISYFKETMERYIDSVSINTQLYPVCFYYDMVLWQTLFHPRAAGFMNSLIHIDMTDITRWILILLLLGLLIVKSGKHYAGFSVTAAITLTGMTAMMTEIALLLVFQSAYGYVYEKVGLFISLFMLGACLGGLIINRLIHHLKDMYKILAYILLGYCIYIFSLLPAIRSTLSIPIEGTQYIFYAMVIATGLLVGAQFPLAVSIISKERSIGSSAGLVWGADLSGAALGTLLASLITIPLLGIESTLIIAGMLCLCGLILLALSRQRLLR